MSRPRILILSFSPIATDARVLKQVALASQLGDVVTCGYGPTPTGVAEHHRIPDELTVYPLNPKLLVARLGRVALHRAAAVRWMRSAVSRQTYDAVIADDLETLPTALGVTSRGGVLADLHEYSPRMHDDDDGWKRYVRPVLESVARQGLPRATACTTVGGIIASEYEKLTGVRPGVVVNAAPYAERAVRVASGPLKLVHSGAALRKRGILPLIDAAEATSTELTLDLYLMPNDPVLLAEIAERARHSRRVTLHDPVPYAELGDTLARYDIGVHVLPPVNVNNEWALPNKLFDYLQARLALIVGPSPEMASVVRERSLGFVTEGFEVHDIQEVMDALSLSAVDNAKRASSGAAHDLSAEKANEAWAQALSLMLDKASAASR